MGFHGIQKESNREFLGFTGTWEFHGILRRFHGIYDG
jgi:hypothetical protein